MKRCVLLVLLTYTLFVVQADLARALTWGPYTPDIVLLCLAPVVLVCRGWPGVAYAAAWGLLTDGLATHGVGAAVISYTVFALGLQRARRQQLLRLPGLFPIACGGLIAGCNAAMLLLRAGQLPADAAPSASQIALHAGDTGLASLVVAAVAWGVWWLLARWLFTDERGRVANRWTMLTE